MWKAMKATLVVGMICIVGFVWAAKSNEDAKKAEAHERLEAKAAEVQRQIELDHETSAQSAMFAAHEIEGELEPVRTHWHVISVEETRAHRLTIAIDSLDPKHPGERTIELYGSHQYYKYWSRLRAGDEIGIRFMGLCDEFWPAYWASYLAPDTRELREVIRPNLVPLPKKAHKAKQK